jgi:hypothetical protein
MQFTDVNGQLILISKNEENPFTYEAACNTGNAWTVEFCWNLEQTKRAIIDTIKTFSSNDVSYKVSIQEETGVENAFANGGQAFSGDTDMYMNPLSGTTAGYPRARDWLNARCMLPIVDTSVKIKVVATGDTTIRIRGFLA